MTEDSLPPTPTPQEAQIEAPSPAPPSASAAATTPVRTRTDLIPWLYGLGFIILAAAIVYLWQSPPTPVDTTSDLHNLDQRQASLESRIGRLEQQPAPPSADDLAKLGSRIDAVQARIFDQSQLASRLDALSGRIESLSGRDQSGLDAIKQQLDQTSSQVKALQSSAGDLQAIADRLGRLARIQAATDALAIGQPLGALPDAPPALVRYADTPPPTQAQLRLSFPLVERAVSAIHPSTTASDPLVQRMWERAQDLVTIRRGDDVIVGNSSAVTLAQARVALDAGDLAGAVAAMGQLAPDAQQVAADWIARAKSLLQVRSALLTMATHA